MAELSYKGPQLVEILLGKQVVYRSGDYAYFKTSTLHNPYDIWLGFLRNHDGMIFNLLVR
jgi:hypothetical protein